MIKEIVENGTSTEAHVLSDADLHSLDPLGECLHSDILGKSFNSILLTFLSNFEKAVSISTGRFHSISIPLFVENFRSGQFKRRMWST